MRTVRVLGLARAAVIAIAVLLLCRDLGAPFNGWHAVNDALHAECARNHVRYGLIATRLYATYAGVAGEPLQRYLNHPPLLAVLTAVPLAVFGDHEWSARLVPILATLGSTGLLMVMLGRLGSPLLGLLAGFFFATLPLTAYFGRMVNHEAPVQFFSLLMIHGYLQWTGAYGARREPRRGAWAWVAGAVLGIATGWAALLTAGLLWCWHALRVRHGSAQARQLVWLAAVPALALAAVILHILAGSGWDLGPLVALVRNRSVGGEGGQRDWPGWLAVQAGYFVRNFTWPGAVAALVGAPLLLGALLRRGDARRWWLPLERGPAAVAAVCGLQGLLWVVLLKNQSWFHDYWQFYLAPFVALSLAALVVAIRRQLGRRAPRLAGLAAFALLIAPMPFAAASLGFYARHQLVEPEYLETLRALETLLPPGAPAWTSHHLHDSSESSAGRTYRWPHPVIAYYADRPLFFSRDPEEVRANAPRCAAYVLRRSDQPWSRAMEAALSASFTSVPVGADHLVFLMGPSPGVRPGERH